MGGKTREERKDSPKWAPCSHTPTVWLSKSHAAPHRDRRGSGSGFLRRDATSLLHRSHPGAPSPPSLHPGVTVALLGTKLWGGLPLLAEPPLQSLPVQQRLTVPAHRGRRYRAQASTLTQAPPASPTGPGASHIPSPSLSFPIYDWTPLGALKRTELGLGLGINCDVLGIPWPFPGLPARWLLRASLPFVLSPWGPHPGAHRWKVRVRWGREREGFI